MCLSLQAGEVRKSQWKISWFVFFLLVYGSVLVITEKAERKALGLMKGMNSADVNNKAMSAEA